MPSSQRPFRIEALRLNGQGLDDARTAVVDRLDRIDSEIAGLKTLIEGSSNEARSFSRREADALWMGVESIQQAISTTKQEVAALHAKGFNGRQLNRATDELSAVVDDTETAAHVILGSAEAIDEVIGVLSKQLSGEQRALLNTAHDHATRIFEACNFQDLSGQRIRKVVDLLQFIEERISTMLLVWASTIGLEDIDYKPTGDEALLNGPALAGDANVVSQAEIDSLFP